MPPRDEPPSSREWCGYYARKEFVYFRFVLNNLHTFVSCVDTMLRIFYYRVYLLCDLLRCETRECVHVLLDSPYYGGVKIKLKHHRLPRLTYQMCQLGRSVTTEFCRIKRPELTAADEEIYAINVRDSLRWGKMREDIGWLLS